MQAHYSVIEIRGPYDQVVVFDGKADALTVGDIATRRWNQSNGQYRVSVFRGRGVGRLVVDNPPKTGLEAWALAERLAQISGMGPLTETEAERLYGSVQPRPFTEDEIASFVKATTAAHLKGPS